MTTTTITNWSLSFLSSSSYENTFMNTDCELSNYLNFLGYNFEIAKNDRDRGDFGIRPQSIWSVIPKNKKTKLLLEDLDYEFYNEKNWRKVLIGYGIEHKYRGFNLTEADLSSAKLEFGDLTDVTDNEIDT